MIMEEVPSQPRALLRRAARREAGVEDAGRPGVPREQRPARLSIRYNNNTNNDNKMIIVIIMIIQIIIFIIIIIIINIYIYI